MFDKHKDKNLYVFGDFNSKHANWNCEKSNVSGNRLNEWLEENELEIIHPKCQTSKKSNSVIDFCIGKCKENWNVERLDEGNSDHYPILFFTPFSAGENGIFRKTNWRMFTFFLQAVYPYWNTFVYNADYNCFFNIFSQFLAALRDRCSDYENIKLFRSPWPPHIVGLVKIVYKYRRKFRRTRFLRDYKDFKYWQGVFMEEKVKFEQEKQKLKLKHMKEGKYILPIFVVEIIYSNEIMSSKNEYHKKENNLEFFSIIWLDLHFNTNDNLYNKYHQSIFIPLTNLMINNGRQIFLR
jgi:hypothetical protein